MPTFARVSHISFSVGDCEKTARWWQEVFGLDEVFRIQEDTWRAILLGLPWGMAIEFQQHKANQGETFDPVRTGFDHMGLKVDSREELLECKHTSSGSASCTRPSSTATTARC